MKRNSILLFRIASVIFAAFGAAASVITLIWLINSKGLMMYPNWLERGGYISSLYINLFSSIICLLGGVYGVALGSHSKRKESFFAIGIVAVSFFAASLLLAGGKGEVTVISICGVIAALSYIITAILMPPAVQRN